MSEILTESFCERCGTRYTFESPVRRSSPLGALGTVGRGLRNFVAQPDQSIDEAFAVARAETEQRTTAHQLEAFHRTFNFCLSCRQYTCGECWNPVEGRCQSCAPLPELEAPAEGHAHAVPDVIGATGLFIAPEALTEAETVADAPVVFEAIAIARCTPVRPLPGWFRLSCPSFRRPRPRRCRLPRPRQAVRAAVSRCRRQHASVVAAEPPSSTDRAARRRYDAGARSCRSAVQAAPRSSAWNDSDNQASAAKTLASVPRRAAAPMKRGATYTKTRANTDRARPVAIAGTPIERQLGAGSGTRRYTRATAPNVAITGTTPSASDTPASTTAMIPPALPASRNAVRPAAIVPSTIAPMTSSTAPSAARLRRITPRRRPAPHTPPTAPLKADAKPPPAPA